MNWKQLRFIITMIAFIFMQASLFCQKVIFLQPYLDTFDLIALSLFAIDIIVSLAQTKLSYKQIIAYILLFISGLITYLATKNAAIAYLALLSIVSMSKSIDDIIKLDLYSKLTILAFVILCYLQGHTESGTFLRDGATRQAFGFSHPNTLGYIVATIYTDFMLLSRNNKSKRKIIINVVLLVIGCLVISAAGSRTSLLFIVASFIMFEFGQKFLDTKQKKKTDRKIAKNISIFMPIIMLVVSICLTFMYNANNPFALKMDDLLSTRIRWQNYYTNNHPVSMFGEEMHFSGMPLDNGYYRILHNLGIMGLIVTLYVCCRAIKRASTDEKEIKRHLLLLSLYAISEWIALRMIVTPYWLIGFTRKDERKLTEQNEN